MKIFWMLWSVLALLAPTFARAAEDKCAACHRRESSALVMEWDRSKHAANGVGCQQCHQGKEGDAFSWKHQGEFVSAIVTPKTCAQCHAEETEQFSKSHHARAGEILASLDNILAEKVAGLPNNKADAVNGCLQCHGGVVKVLKDEKGEVKRTGAEGDGSKGSCNACHSRHSFEAKLARNPENCGKCHMGPDHPQIEIYNESKHGIAFHANKDKMALDKDSWVLGKDYSAAPTCATCHISSYMGPDGQVKGNTHDVGERISWTLRPVISSKLNMVVFKDGFKEDYPDSRALPKVGDSVETIEKVVEKDMLVSKKVTRIVDRILTWDQRRGQMQAVCANCHGKQFVSNFYEQYDSLVTLYNEKFAKPAKGIMDELLKDGVLNAKAPFEHDVQWEFWELWHHEGRRARHGASMMGPDYTHWHGMYEVSKTFYIKFLPAVVKAAEEKSPELGKKWKAKIDALMTREEHAWRKGLSPEEAEQLKKEYQLRYNQ
ncbi:MAG: Cytochrome c552 [Elusimicrobia bacterium]|nr:MAG: Cytochrome c552 [Elusimicrobiota bacterium]